MATPLFIAQRRFILQLCERPTHLLETLADAVFVFHQCQAQIAVSFLSIIVALPTQYPTRPPAMLYDLEKEPNATPMSMAPGTARKLGAV